MGGIGSGFWSRFRARRATLADLPRVDVINLYRRGVVTPEMDNVGSTALDWTPCNFGGQRPWFCCPERHCARRVAVLYESMEGRLMCNRCSGLSYASQHQTRETRLLIKFAKLRFRLGGDPSTEVPHPPKPKYMRQRTYKRLCGMANKAEHDMVLSLVRNSAMDPLFNAQGLSATDGCEM